MDSGVTVEWAAEIAGEDYAIHVIEVVGAGILKVVAGGNVQAPGDYSEAIHFPNAMNSFVILDGGIVTATDQECSAIETNQNVTVLSGMVSVDGIGAKGIEAWGNVVVNAGSVLAIGEQCTPIWKPGIGTVTVTGGKISGAGSNGKAIYADGAVDIQAGTISAEGTYNMVVRTGTNITMSGGTILSSGEYRTALYAEGTGPPSICKTVPSR